MWKMMKYVTVLVYTELEAFVALLTLCIYT